MLDISVIILTLNEEKHIERCITSMQSIAKAIFVVDCFSTDATKELAEQNNATVIQRNWPGNQAAQLNWALENLPIKTKWILRLDADEYITPELEEEFKNKLPGLPKEITGAILPLRRVFLERTIRKGTNGIKMLRLFQYKKAVCEQRWMDEHMQLLEGRAIEFEHEFADHNLNNLSWWTQKHNNYAIREAIDLLDIELGLINKHQSTSLSSEGAGEALIQQAAAKRRKKLHYAKQPLFWRSFAYFIYRYIFKLGFLEGKEGFLWHFLQAWWYRTLVDAKIWIIKRDCGKDVDKIKKYVKKVYGMDI